MTPADLITLIGHPLTGRNHPPRTCVSAGFGATAEQKALRRKADKYNLTRHIGGSFYASTELLAMDPAELRELCHRSHARLLQKELAQTKEKLLSASAENPNAALLHQAGSWAARGEIRFGLVPADHGFKAARNYIVRLPDGKYLGSPVGHSRREARHKANRFPYSQAQAAARENQGTVETIKQHRIQVMPCSVWITRHGIEPTSIYHALETLTTLSMKIKNIEQQLEKYPLRGTAPCD